jgi:hypothetical protein
MATLLNKLFDFNSYQMLIAGFALMLTAVGNPDGIAKEMQGGYFKVLARLERALGRDPAPVTVLGPRGGLPPDDSAEAGAGPDAAGTAGGLGSAETKVAG